MLISHDIMKKYNIIILLFLLFVDTAHSGIHNDLKFNHIGIAQGLSHATVSAIAQDLQGYMWIATPDGLNRYDGYSFRVYRHEYDDNSIATNLLNRIELDKNGNLWVSGKCHISKYDFSAENFQNYYPEIDGSISDIHSLDNGFILVGTSDGLFTFNPSNGTFTKGYETIEFDKTVVSISRKDSDVYISAGTEGLYHLNLENSSITRLPLDNTRYVASTLPDGNSLFVATEGNGLLRIETSTGNVLNHYVANGPEGLYSNYVRSMALDSQKKLWVGTFTGLDILDQERKKFSHYDTMSEGADNLSHNSVRRIYADHMGGMWLGTFFGGLNYYHPLRNQFQTLRHSPLQPSLNDDVLGVIVEDADKTLWIGTNKGGVNHYNPIDGSYSHFTMANGLGSNDVKAIYIDPLSSMIYIGSHLGGLNVLDKRTGRISSVQGAPGNIYAILPALKKGFLWLATLDKLVLYNMLDGSCENVPANGLSRMTDLYRDSEGRLWVSGEDGISAFRESDGGALSLCNEVPEKINRYGKAVNNVYQSREKLKYYISTNEGLLQYSADTGRLKAFTTQQGMPNDIVYGVLEDANGNLWCSTNYGIAFLNPSDGSVGTYTAHDGLQSNQFNHKSFLRSSSGYLYFGGINGLTYFNPSILKSNPYAPQPIISRLRLFNTTVLPGDDSGLLQNSVAETEKITFNPDQTVFTIDFTVCNYVAGSHNTFSYILEGLDTQWTTVDGAGAVTYSNLPAGKYRFLLKAANNDGVWCDDTTTLEIVILPKWYNRWWARLIFAILTICAIAAVVAYFWRRKARHERERLANIDRERQNEINEMKVRFFINMSHELRTPLTLILLPIQELLQKAIDKKTIQKLTLVKNNAERILHIVNQLLDYRRAEMGMFRLKTEKINVNDLILKIFANYEYQALRLGIDYRLDRTLPDSLIPCDPQYIELICNNLLSNAFKYTPKGQSIRMSLSSGGAPDAPTIIITVSDTGCGIPSDKLSKIFTRFYMVDERTPGTGIGLSLVKRLVELHHGTIKVESELGQGTTFTVELPVGEGEFSAEETAQQTSGSITDTSDTPIYLPEIYSDYEEEPGGYSCSKSEKETILVVDDNPDILKYICDGLSEDFNVIPAANGAKAIEILSTQNIDLILTDIMMPDVDGIQLCRTIKRNLRTSHIPVIMLSAKSDATDQLGGLRVGADDYIAKPFSMEILISKIKNQLRTRRLAIRHFTENAVINPESVALNPLDEEFLKKAMATMERHLDNTEFSTDIFAGEMCMSRSNLHLKMKALTGESTNEFIRRFRMNRAMELLQSGRYNISQVSAMVGYGTASYFTTTFKKFFGNLPSVYIKND